MLLHFICLCGVFITWHTSTSSYKGESNPKLIEKIIKRESSQGDVYDKNPLTALSLLIAMCASKSLIDSSIKFNVLISNKISYDGDSLLKYFVF